MSKVKKESDAEEKKEEEKEMSDKKEFERKKRKHSSEAIKGLKEFADEESKERHKRKKRTECTAKGEEKDSGESKLDKQKVKGEDVAERKYRHVHSRNCEHMRKSERKHRVNPNSPTAFRKMAARINAKGIPETPKGKTNLLKEYEKMRKHGK